MELDELLPAFAARPGIEGLAARDGFGSPGFLSV